MSINLFILLYEYICAVCWPELAVQKDSWYIQYNGTAEWYRGRTAFQCKKVQRSIRLLLFSLVLYSPKTCDQVNLTH